MTPSELCELIYRSPVKSDTPKDGTDGNMLFTMSRMAENLIDWFLAGNLDLVNEFYKTLDVERAPAAYTAMACRTMWCRRNEVEEYESYRVRAIEAAKRLYPDQMQDAYYGIVDKDGNINDD